MPESNNMNIEAAYQKAKQVFNKELTQAGAAKQLFENHGINENSAKIMLAVYKKLVSGIEFKRALSAPDMSYFLERILAENGPNSLIKPLSALWKHIEYYEQKNNVSLNAMREVALSFSSSGETGNSIENIERQFQNEVLHSLNSNAEERRRRLARAEKAPKVRVVSVAIFERNPDVVAEVLLRANGHCENCKLAAPFTRRKDNTPYLEVHHKKRLADGGQDTVENAIGLCPNCHRKMHFGNI